MGYILANKSSVLQWLPSVDGLMGSSRLMHEAPGLAVARLR
jgi:hypothetical protein